MSILYGASLGDAMGAYCEFTSPNDKNYKQIWTEVSKIFMTARGQVTDDSELAISLAYGILENIKGKITNPDSAVLNYDPIAFYYGLWYCSGPFDVGNTTSSAFNFHELQDYVEKKDIYNSGLAKKFKTKSLDSNMQSKSNGFLMRHWPMTVYLYYFFEMNKNEEFYFKKLVDGKKYEILFIYLLMIGGEDSEITNPNPECKAASVVYDFIILSCLYYFEENGNDTSLIYKKISEFLEYSINSEIVAIVELRSNLQNIYDVMNKINSYPDFESVRKSNFIVEIGVEKIGYYLHAIKLIFFLLRYFPSFMKLNQENPSIENLYINLMYFICNLGGDTDTNCCIVGAVVGALVKLGNIDGDFLYPHISFNSDSPNNMQRRWVLYSPLNFGLYAIKLFDIMDKPKDRKL